MTPSKSIVLCLFPVVNNFRVSLLEQPQEFVHQFAQGHALRDLRVTLDEFASISNSQTRFAHQSQSNALPKVGCLHRACWLEGTFLCF
jgi:hypothetical protein